PLRGAADRRAAISRRDPSDRGTYLPACLVASSPRSAPGLELCPVSVVPAHDAAVVGAVLHHVPVLAAGTVAPGPDATHADDRRTAIGDGLPPLGAVGLVLFGRRARFLRCIRICGVFRVRGAAHQP